MHTQPKNNLNRATVEPVQCSQSPESQCISGLIKEVAGMQMTFQSGQVKF